MNIRTCIDYVDAKTKLHGVVTAVGILLFALNLRVGSAHAEVISVKSSPRLPIVAAFRDLNKDFFRLATGEGKDIELRYTLNTPRSFKTSNVNLSSHTLLFSAELPIPVSPNYFWRISPRYQYQHYNFNDLQLDETPFKNTDIHRIELGTGFGYFLNRDLLLTTMIYPGLHSNLSGVDSDHFQLYSQGFLVYRYRESIEFILGTVSSELFDELALFPVIGLRAKAFDGRFHLKITPPVELRLRYSLSDSWDVFAGFWLKGDESRVEAFGKSFQIQTREQRLGAGIMRWFSAHWNVHIEAGVELGSRLEFELVEANAGGSLQNSFYSALSLGYAL